ncbi:MAG TPA: folylpolyglutamate synthase/dihydrofolate synthase family protein [Mycobacteriales bacterium]|nr:folylpolyglutamate synthase/dihydrofolate synthase family protein [Mycobacteriales bacterium]
MTDRVGRALAARIDGEKGMLGLDPDIARMVDLMDVLGSPQKSYPSIHVAGTNGKTSTTRIIDAILRAFGLRTGRYTSPDLSNVRERIALDGVMISAERFERTYDEIAPFLSFVDSRHDHRVTYFEALTAMGLAAFADAPVDVAVVEVGLGGRWDATNVLAADTCVITPIGLDHVEILGDTLASVAGEKVGIIHDGARVISGVQTLEAAEVIVRRVAETGAVLAVEGVQFGVASRAVALGGQSLTIAGIAGTYDDLFLPLHGAHQASNAACAIAAVETFLGGASAALDVDAVREGLLLADSPGRLEVVRRSPTILLDGAHNPDGVAALAAALEEAFTFDYLVGVVGILADKDAVAMLTSLEPLLNDVVVTTNHSPRALSADDLAAVATQVFGRDRVHRAATLPDAIDTAVALADRDTSASAGVVVTGSLYTVGEARTLLVT